MAVEERCDISRLPEVRPLRKRTWRPKIMASTRSFARKEAAFVTVVWILVGSLSAASGQDTHQCEPSSVKECYLRYKGALWWGEFRLNQEGEYDEEEYKKGCSRITEKQVCHEDLAGCPEAINGDYRIQERGYEAMRNIVCDNTLREFHKAFQCRDEEKLEACARTMLPASDPQDAGTPSPVEEHCRLHPIEVACFDQAFNSTCPMPMKTAKAAFMRVVDALALLGGCASSAHAVVASKGFLVLLIAPVLLSSSRT
ncbi:uncharacterized protein LOC119466137 isoform X2 [Dermacentor silvarum]|uniref:uncharacterized protein LOC119466137 isoform X2 n=2 Tax=Dermacentor silvarum TaxID=543639 RepID=UPI0021009873|nr:uncharacterized protein LOC119466137 isoform X2 [Dermacentor silvarum]